MNWLMYIGGCFIFGEVMLQIIEKLRKSNKEKWDKSYERFTDVFSLMVWIWICWRFIK